MAKRRKFNARLADAKRQHDKWLRKKGVHPAQLKHREKSIGKGVPDYSTDCESLPTSDVVTSIQGKRRKKEYSGDYIIGLATMHKSNIVPVGKGTQPEDYAKMRR